MSSVTFSFNLDPVVSAPVKATDTSQADQSVSEKYRASEARLQSYSGNAAALNGTQTEGGYHPSVSSQGPGVTTLAIGEEDGGFAGAGPQTGVLQSTDIPPPIGGFSAPGNSPLPRQGIVEVAPAVETVPIVGPRLKPAVLAGLETPYPGIKPEQSVATADAAQYNGTFLQAEGPVEQTYISVGDYDSYLAASGSGGQISSTADIGADESSVQSVGGTVLNAAAVYVPPPLAPIESFEFTVSEPVSAETTADNSKAVPVITPAKFTTTQPSALPVSLPPVEIISPESTVNGTAVPETATAGLSAAASESFLNSPVPLEKPPEMSKDLPRLSEDDLRITTLAFGEEEAGGG